MTGPTLAVTGLNATDNPGPGVGVLRSLAEGGLRARLVGLAYDALEPGLYHRALGLEAAYLLPYPSQGSDALLARIREIHAQRPLDLILPTLDAELPGFIALEPQLRALGIRTLLPTRAQLDARAKTALEALCAKAGVEAPRGETVRDPDQCVRAAEGLGFPVMVKGPFYGALRADGPDDAVAAFHRTLASWGGPVLVQKCHAGDELDVVAVGDGEGELCGAVAMKKLVLTAQGKAWAGVTVRDDALLEVAAKLVRALRWRGPCEVEVLRTREGRYLVLEVNPRFPAWTHLATGAGQNLPRLVAQLAFGERPAKLVDYEAGVMFVRIALDQITRVEELHHIVGHGGLRVPRDPEAA